MNELSRRVAYDKLTINIYVFSPSSKYHRNKKSQYSYDCWWKVKEIPHADIIFNTLQVQIEVLKRYCTT